MLEGGAQAAVEARELMKTAAERLEVVSAGLARDGVSFVDAQRCCEALEELYAYSSAHGVAIIEKGAPRALLLLPELGKRAKIALGEQVCRDLVALARRLRNTAASCDQLEHLGKLFA